MLLKICIATELYVINSEFITQSSVAIQIFKSIYVINLISQKFLKICIFLEFFASVFVFVIVDFSPLF